MAAVLMPSSHHRVSSTAPLPSPNNPRQPSSSSSHDSTLKPFTTRIRSTLEQSLRAATRSRKMPVPVPDDFATIQSKGKERADIQEQKEREKEKSGGMLRRLESKVNFRRSGRDSVTPSPSPVPPPLPSKPEEKVRVAGRTSYITPSLRQASISSPALHLSSQALPSPKSQSAVPASSSSTSDVLASPVRERPRRSLPPRDSPTSSRIAHTPSRHRATKSVPIDIPSPPQTPTKFNHEPSSPPGTPTPMRAPLSRHLSLAASSSTTQLPLNSPPLTPRGSSPIRARSPSTTRRVVSPSHRGLSSSSTSHLPISPSSSPTPGKTARRTSFDAPRRPSISREDSPSPVRPRPTSPNSRSYVHNRHYNISSTSLIEPSNPEQRSLIRTATSMLCKAVVKPPPHLKAGSRDWEEVERRINPLARLERIWGKSGASSSNVHLGVSSSGISASGEERERRLFTEALRDGFVLCQLLNKVRASNVVRPDVREDGFSRTSNITKFLAGCASYGLSNEDLFLRDDLIEASGESLARVAKTIVVLIKSIDTPIPERSKFVTGKGSGGTMVSGPYKLGSRSASSSSPNLSISTNGTRATSPSSPNRKRFSPSGLPTVRSDSPNEGSVSKAGGMTQDDREEALVDDDREVKDVPTPPPRSPLRARSPKPANIPDDGRALLNWARANASPPRADSTRAFVGEESAREDPNSRQSTASAMTDVTASTATTVLSSLMDVGRNSSAAFSKFGTIRTITTEATSESPSISRTEGSSIADDIRKRSLDHHRERKLSEAPVVDLSRVAEETDESGSSRRGKRREEARRRDSEGAERIERIRLGKGKWPDDFMDIQNLHGSPTPPSPSSPLDMEDRFKRSTSQLSSSPRKLAVVDGGRRNESVESLPQFPRRPTHRARHSIDTPPSVLLPKDAVFRRDVSPDGLPSSSRVILRRNNSAKPTNRNGVLAPRGGDDPRGSDNETAVPVPFPRTVSGEHTPARSSDNDHSGSERPERPALDVPRHPRGRFQSDVEGMSSRRRGRPNSYDELGAKPIRSRFESMVNLGGPSGHTSASDLLSRDSMESSGVRKPLIIKEEGKLPTHFQLGNCIGRGQFGSVYRALNLNTGQMVAVKRIRLEGLKEEEVTQLMREVDLVKRLSHPSIVKYEGMHRDSDTLSIVLEYAENGSLAHTIKAFGKLNEKLVASYVLRILEGLHYLHQSEVVHCDLKAANILTTKNGNVKLSDFGVSLNMRAMEREIKDVAGTPNWMAPEVIELKGASPKSDIWSLACTVIELFTGRPPYGDIANSMSVMFRIVEDDMPPIPPGCSPLLEDFLRKCFNKDPTQRPSAELLCEHQWLKQNWGAHKELRPQDSIPFLRRVSADLQKSEAVRYLSQIDMDGSQDHISASPPGRRMSNTSMRPSFDNEIAPREHSFVKTTFSKPMICRVCLLNVKKSAVLCEQCSLICHSKCAHSAPPTCDLRAQLLLYAQYAEKGNPGSAYSNPVDVFSDAHPRSPMSDVPFVSHTPRTSLDTNPPIPVPPSPSVHSGVPPTAFKHNKFMGAFKRPKHHADSQTSVSSSPPPETRVVRKPTVLRKNHDGRPQSLGSNSTNPHSSVRSAGTVASAGRRSTVSDAVSSAIGESIVRTGISEVGGQDGRIPEIVDHSSRHRKTKSSNNCIVQ